MSHYLVLMDDNSDIEMFYYDNEEYFEDVLDHQRCKEKFRDFIYDECDLPAMVEKVITVKQLVENCEEDILDYYCCDSVLYNEEEDLAEFYTRSNPNGLYDWCEEGGRWAKHYKNKKGAYVQEFTINDISWSRTKKGIFNDRKKSQYSNIKDMDTWQDQEVSPCFLILNGTAYEPESDIEFFELIEEHSSPETVFTVYDFHN